MSPTTPPTECEDANCVECSVRAGCTRCAAGFGLMNGICGDKFSCVAGFVLGTSDACSCGIDQCLNCDIEEQGVLCLECRDSAYNLRNETCLPWASDCLSENGVPVGTGFVGRQCVVSGSPPVRCVDGQMPDHLNSACSCETENCVSCEVHATGEQCMACAPGMYVHHVSGACEPEYTCMNGLVEGADDTACSCLDEGCRSCSFMGTGYMCQACSGGFYLLGDTRCATDEECKEAQGWPVRLDANTGGECIATTVRCGQNVVLPSGTPCSCTDPNCLSCDISPDGTEQCLSCAAHTLPTTADASRCVADECFDGLFAAGDFRGQPCECPTEDCRSCFGATCVRCVRRRFLVQLPEATELTCEKRDVCTDAGLNSYKYRRSYAFCTAADSVPCHKHVAIEPFTHLRCRCNIGRCAHCELSLNGQENVCTRCIKRRFLLDGRCVPEDTCQAANRVPIPNTGPKYAM